MRASPSLIAWLTRACDKKKRLPRSILRLGDLHLHVGTTYILNWVAREKE